MPEQEKISKRDAEIQCIELDQKYFKGNPNKFQKIKNFFRVHKSRPR